MVILENVKVGISPIGWSNDDFHELGGEISFDACIREAAGAGYQGLEIGYKFPKDPEEIKQALAGYRLKVVSQWFSCYFTTKPQEETVTEFKDHMSFLKATGTDVIVVAECGGAIHGNPDIGLVEGKPMIESEEGWQKLADGLNVIGKIAVENDMIIVYHHHMGTVVQTKEEIETLMKKTDSNYVNLLLDTGHYKFAGGDPKNLLAKFANRIKHVHLKDVRKEIIDKTMEENLSFHDAVVAGVFTVPGDGDIDYEPLAKILQNINYKGWLIVEAEQDPEKADPFEYAVTARKYITEIFGV